MRQVLGPNTMPIVGRGADALRRVGRFPGYARPRRFQLFNVGLDKTGTTSVARIFGRYRAAHELDWARILPLATAWYQGDAADSMVRRELRRRDWRFRLEMDSAGFLVPFADRLAELHPRAGFIVTIRDCFSWLASRLDWDVAAPTRRVNDRARAFARLEIARRARYSERFRPEESALETAGVRYPVAAELRFWAETNARTLEVLPPERFLVVRTEDLDSSIDILAQFARVRAGSLVPMRANEQRDRANILRRVPKEFVTGLAYEHCAPLMERFWGADWPSLQDRATDLSSRDA